MFFPVPCLAVLQPDHLGLSGITKCSLRGAGATLPFGFSWALWDLHTGRNHCGRLPLNHYAESQGEGLDLYSFHCKTASFFPGSLLCSNHTHTKKVSSGGSYSWAVWTQASQSCLVSEYSLFSNTSFDLEILVRTAFISYITYSSDPTSWAKKPWVLGQFILNWIIHGSIS